jgi:hypothetical protein
MIDPKSRDLSDFGHLLIRRAILRDDWVAEAIFNIAAEGQQKWDTRQWAVLLAGLESSKQTVNEWLTTHESI